MIKPLTSLRFFFAFFVFLSHLYFLEKEKNMEYIVKNLFSEGFLGVSFFFILSGFILALNYREKFQNKTISLRAFYIARFARIYPLFFITMLAAVPFAYSGIKVLICNTFLLQSYIPYEKYFFSLNAPSWSISDEMFFYALFPFLIGITYKLGSFIKILLCFSFIFLIVILNVTLAEDQAHYWLYISPFVRVFDFVLGILLLDFCLYLKKIKTDFNPKLFSLFEVSAFALLMIFFLCKDYVSISYRYSIYYWLPMCLIILTAANSFIFEKKETFISNMLSRKWLVYLGEISFGFYLIHYLVIFYMIRYDGFMGIHLEGLPLACAMFIVTLITSIFAFEKIEKPFNKKIKRLLS
ncbi:acyltransferase [Epilithonimonas sp. JDS]|uniref:acyltransferase family protein n=1 Tax=Epilithonimonas sp. JDS TaxID=2902797 RepID=UPI001E5D6DD7|nr:acyltransferase [Epilithonimonas sp. JDS]MCD9854176.1 acyltransferase [Epilithonimonas sp. JDS]